MKYWLPILLSLNAGYVDTAGFVALQGLFTAHVTGNFVTFGAALALGAAGATPKLLALPVFCIVVILLRVLTHRLQAQAVLALRAMLVVKCLLLVVGAFLAIRLGPFRDADNWRLLLTGMVLVSAMAIQNAVHRIYLGTAPPTTLMTGTTTQIMIDLADLLHGVPPADAPALRSRLTRMSLSVAAFAIGCGTGALFYVLWREWCFVVPPILASFAPFLVENAPNKLKP